MELVLYDSVSASKKMKTPDFARNQGFSSFALQLSAGLSHEQVARSLGAMWRHCAVGHLSGNHSNGGAATRSPRSSPVSAARRRALARIIMPTIASTTPWTNG